MPADPAQQSIADAIPHRPPMLLIDGIVERDERRIICSKTFRADEFFFQGHYPENPIVPGVILCECAGQAAALLLSAGQSSVERVPVLTRLNQVKFKQLVRPGETVLVAVQWDDQVADAYYLSARLTRGDRTVATLSLACKLVSQSKD